MIEPVRARGVLSTVTREEVWTLGAAGALREQRLSHGAAEFLGDRVEAIDVADDELLAVSDEAMSAARDALSVATEGSARIIVSARRPPDRSSIVSTHIIVSTGALSFVSAPHDLAADAALFAGFGNGQDPIAIDYHDAALVWRNGTAAVLMHEAAGHASEHQRDPIEWPEWLTVRDEPDVEFDDAGRAAVSCNLLRGERPRHARCASFAAVPLERMSNVVVAQREAPIGVPNRRIDIRAVSGGAYDPLTDRVQIAVTVADLVDGSSTARIRPFVIDEPRTSVAFALRGATGTPHRYPGVVCSSEGQELVVGSHAPVLLTQF